MLIGDKKVFALEYEEDDTESIFMASNCLWIEGKFIGEPDNSGMLYGMYCVLKVLLKKKDSYFEPEFIDKSPEEILITMIPDLLDKSVPNFTGSKYEVYRYSFPENYDQFRIRIYAIDGVYYFVWGFFPEVLLGDGRDWVENYSTEIQSASVHQGEIEYVFNELERIFPAWK